MSVMIYFLDGTTYIARNISRIYSFENGLLEMYDREGDQRLYGEVTRYEIIYKPA